MTSRAQPVHGVRPALLKWARETANMSTAEVAAKFKRAESEIEDWERGASAPTYPQLEKLAYELYKRPLAIFFLPEPPQEPKPTTEFRSLPNSELASLQRHTVLLIRRARAFQSALEEVYDGRNPAPNPIWRDVHLAATRPVAEQAEQLRAELGVSLDAVRAAPTDDDALKVWRRAIESRGVFVFKDAFKQGEISGFCLTSREFPVIFINNVTTKTRQVFSLIHELAHLLFERSGISRFDNVGIEDLPPSDRGIERFCNSIAAEVLVPATDLDAAIANWVEDPETVGDAAFAALAERYHVSRSAVLFRLVEIGRASATFAIEKDREWAARSGGPRGSGGNYYNTQGAYLSETFLREVVSRYARRQLSKVEAADLIGVKPKNFGAFEDLVLRAVNA